VPEGGLDPAAAPPPTTFAGAFWDVEGAPPGFDTLVLKHRNGKEVCKDMAEFMRQRAAIEDAYAKQLMKLSRATLADFEHGFVGLLGCLAAAVAAHLGLGPRTMKTAWAELKRELNVAAQAHLMLATKVLSGERRVCQLFS
jgi:hypothetical protein